MHFGDGALGGVDFGIEDVGGAAVDVDCARGIRGWDWREGGGGGLRTDWVHGHAQVLDGAELAEDLADVRFFDVLC